MTKPTVSIERNAEGKLVKLNSYVVTLCEIDGDDVAAARMDYYQNKEEVHKAVREKFKGWKIKTINKLYDEDFAEE
jgi:hypothetical protein